MTEKKETVEKEDKSSSKKFIEIMQEETLSKETFVRVESIAIVVFFDNDKRASILLAGQTAMFTRDEESIKRLRELVQGE